MRTKSWTAVVMTALSIAAVGCGSGATSTSQDGAAAGAAVSTEQQDQGDPDRFCRLTEQLDAAGQKAFAGLGRDASPADYRRAERRFVLANTERLDALEPALPERLRDEVRTFVTTMRQRGGLEPAGTVSQADASAAERALLAYEGRACER